MLRLRIALTFLVTVALVTGLEGQFGQPFPARTITPTPLASLVLAAADDPNIVAELNLSDEQVKALVARRTELWNEAYVTPATKLAEGAAERNKATDAVMKKVLTEAQYKRAVQLGAQNILSRGGFGGGGGFGTPDVMPNFVLTRVTSAILNRYPELVDAFKLTEEQKKELATPNTSKISGKTLSRPFSMSPEQVKAATEFIGPVFTKPWFSKFDRRANPPTEPQELSVLGATDVRTALKVTNEQLKGVTEAQDKWSQLVTSLQSDLSPKEANEKAKGLTAETEQALAKVLKPEQLARLKQIAFQANHGSSIELAYRSEDVAKALALSEKQVKELDGVWDAHRASVAKALEVADSFAAADKQVKELAAARQAKAEAVLNTDQGTKLKEMIGEVFVGNTRSDSMFGSPFPRITPSMRLFITGSAAFGEALKLTPEQSKTIAAAREAYQKAAQASQPTGPGGGGFLTPELIAARNAALDDLQKAIDTTLTPEQTKRVPQLVLQSNAAANLVNALTAIETSAVLGLAPDQIAKLNALDEDAMQLQNLRAREAGVDPDRKLALKLRDAADERMMAVLNANQKAKWKEMIGEPWVGLTKTIPTRFGGGGRGSFGPGGPGSGFPGGGFPGGGFGPFDP